jgi:hypothetical protein
MLTAVWRCGRAQFDDTAAKLMGGGGAGGGGEGGGGGGGGGGGKKTAAEAKKAGEEVLKRVNAQSDVMMDFVRQRVSAEVTSQTRHKHVTNTSQTRHKHERHGVQRSNVAAAIIATATGTATSQHRHSNFAAPAQQLRSNGTATAQQRHCTTERRPCVAWSALSHRPVRWLPGSLPANLFPPTHAAAGERPCHRRGPEAVVPLLLQGTAKRV